MVRFIRYSYRPVVPVFEPVEKKQLQDNNPKQDFEKMISKKILSYREIFHKMLKSSTRSSSHIYSNMSLISPSLAERAIETPPPFTFPLMCSVGNLQRYRKRYNLSHRL